MCGVCGGIQTGRACCLQDQDSVTVAVPEVRTCDLHIPIHLDPHTPSALTYLAARRTQVPVRWRTCRRRLWKKTMACLLLRKNAEAAAAGRSVLCGSWWVIFRCFHLFVACMLVFLQYCIISAGAFHFAVLSARSRDRPSFAYSSTCVVCVVYVREWPADTIPSPEHCTALVKSRCVQISLCQLSWSYDLGRNRSLPRVVPRRGRLHAVNVLLFVERGLNHVNPTYSVGQ